MSEVDAEEFRVLKVNELEAMQAELSALREELAAEKARSDREIDSADEESSALRECIRDFKDWREHSQSYTAFASILDRAGAVIPAPGPLQQRLTAAEQRNSELLKAVEQSIEWFERISSGDGSGHADLARAIRRIAKLNPIESMPDACTSCDGSGEYTDAIGDWRGYCSCPAGMALKNTPTESGASE